MSEAKVSNETFQELHNRFMNTYGDSIPPIVMYYRENEKVCVYMRFAGITWETEIGVEFASKYISIFPNAIKLIEGY